MAYQNRLVAHRGYQQRYPENTIVAYRQAIAAGALNIETDILLSADLQPVLYHDPTLKRVSGKRGKVCELSLAQLCQLPAYEPGRLGEQFISETIAPLSALVHLLTMHPQVTAYVEIKKEAIAHAGIPATYAAVTDYLQTVASQCYLISFDYAFMAYARGRGWARCGVVLEKWHDLENPDVRAANPDSVFCNYRKIPRKARLKDVTSEIVLYEIADPELARHWLERGAAKIETFDIGAMIKQLNILMDQ